MNHRGTLGVLLGSILSAACSSERTTPNESGPTASGDRAPALSDERSERSRSLAQGKQRAIVDDGVSGVTAALAMLMIRCTGTIGPDSFVLDADGFLKLPDGFRCTQPEATGKQYESDLRAYLSLQYREQVSGDQNGRLVIPNAKELIAGRWATWKRGVEQKGLTQAQCPVWKEIITTEASSDDQLAVLAGAERIEGDEEDSNLGVWRTKESVNLEYFQSITDFDVKFERSEPTHECSKQGPGACAELCAGAFPGFVIESSRSSVKTDPMSWLMDTVYGDVNFNPYLRSGFYHPTHAYALGPQVTSRWRANNCGATTTLYPFCNRRVRGYGPGSGDYRACSDNHAVCPPDNCPTETCSVGVTDTIYQVTTITLDCLGDLAAQLPGTPGWQAVWDTCVGYCSLD